MSLPNARCCAILGRRKNRGPDIGLSGSSSSTASCVCGSRMTVAGMPWARAKNQVMSSSSSFVMP